MLLLASLAFSGEPERCVAEWAGRQESCEVRPRFDVVGAGRNAVQAEKAARSQLTAALKAHAAAAKAANPVIPDSGFEGCAAAAQEAFVDCFPEPVEPVERYCFVSLDDPSCWTGDILNVEGPTTRVYALGAETMCRAVSTHLTQQNYTDLAEAQVRCAAQCLSETVVRCP